MRRARTQRGTSLPRTRSYPTITLLVATKELVPLLSVEFHAANDGKQQTFLILLKKAIETVLGAVVYGLYDGAHASLPQLVHSLRYLWRTMCCG